MPPPLPYPVTLENKVYLVPLNGDPTIQTYVNDINTTKAAIASLNTQLKEQIAILNSQQQLLMQYYIQNYGGFPP